MREIKNKIEFEENIANNKRVVLDFYAEWCGPCKVLLPILEELSIEHDESVSIYKVNVDTNPDLAAQFGVRSIPSVFFINECKIVDQFVGLLSKEQVNQKLVSFVSA